MLLSAAVLLPWGVTVVGNKSCLPVIYHHLVFSGPHALVPLLWQNKNPVSAPKCFGSAATSSNANRNSDTYLSNMSDIDQLFTARGPTLQPETIRCSPNALRFAIGVSVATFCTSVPMSGQICHDTGLVNQAFDFFESEPRPGAAPGNNSAATGFTH